jgi:hypothetical protein
VIALLADAASSSTGIESFFTGGGLTLVSALAIAIVAFVTGRVVSGPMYRDERADRIKWQDRCFELAQQVGRAVETVDKAAAVTEKIVDKVVK